MFAKVNYLVRVVDLSIVKENTSGTRIRGCIRELEIVVGYYLEKSDEYLGFRANLLLSSVL